MAESETEATNSEPTNLVGGLSAEIERVSKKYDRWKGYASDQPDLAGGLAIGLMVMGNELEIARRALNGGDPIEMMSAIESLRGYDDND